MKNFLLYSLAFLVKGWQVSLLLLLPILQLQGKISFFDIGFLGMIMSIFQVGANFYSGHLSEKIGSKKVIALSMLLFTASWITLLGSSYLFLVLAYCLDGIACGLFLPLANSVVAKISPENRASRLGNFAAVTDLGRVLFSGLTTFFVSRFGINSFSLIFTLISAIFLVAFYLTHNLKLASVKEEELTKTSLRALLANKRYLLVVLIGILDASSSVSLFIFLPLLLVPKGISLESTGFLTALFFLGYFCGRIILGRFADKFGASKILIVSEIAMAILILLLIFINIYLIVALVIFILGAFTRGTSPIIRAMVAHSVSENHKFDKAYSFHSFSLNTSTAIVRPIFGFSAGIFGVASVFYLCSLIVALNVIPILKYSKKIN